MSMTGGIEKVHEYRWDTGTLSWVPWDGSLSTGAITIGTVDQGNGGLSAWKVDGSGVVQPISAAALPLPSGASTEATLALIKAKTDNLDLALSTRAVTGLTDTQLRATPVPVSGAVTVSDMIPAVETGLAKDASVLALTKPADQQHTIVDSSALPSGASTETTLALVKAKTDNLDAALSTRTKPSDQQHVIIDSGGSAGGPATIADGADVVEGMTTDAAVSTDTTGTLSGKLRGIVKLLASVISGGKVLVTTDPITGSVTVSNFPADQLVHATNLDVALSTRTKPSDQQHVIVDSSASVPVTGPLTDAQLRATPVLVSGTITADAGTNLNTSLLALEAGGNLASIKTDLDEIATDTDKLDVALSTRLKPADTLTKVATVDTITNPLPAGTNVIGHMIADTGSTTAVTGNVTVVQPTNANLKADVTSNAANIATEATQLLVKADVDKIPSQGQAAMASSMPVVIASNQSAVSTNWNGTAPPIGAGVEATGLRVTLATDSTGQVKLAAGVAEIGNVKNSGTFAVQATLNAETTKVIGTVNMAAGQTIAVTNAGTFVVQAAQSVAANLNMTEASAAAIKSDADTLVTNTNPLVAAAAGGYVRQDSTATIAKEAGGNLATIAAKDFATQATLATLLADLAIVQGASSANQVGPMIQALVADAPPSIYLDGYIQPLSLTQQGRLRVASEDSTAMTDFWGDPFQQNLLGSNPFDELGRYDFWA